LSAEPQTTDSGQKGERLQRVLASRGVASRRKAEELIRAGRVSVNGVVVTELGTRVDPEKASIRVDGKPVKRQARRYYLLHKPSGFITTKSDERGRQTVMELVPAEPGLFPVGRLDRDTEGLLLLTNDGDIANRVMHPRYGLTKEYLVLTPRKPSEAIMSKVRDGIVIDGKLVVPHEFRVVRETANGVLLSVVLHEGMNHVVRRLMDAAGIPVTHLRRERIGPLSLAGIPRGSYRELTRGELISLRQALHLDAEEIASASPTGKMAGSVRTPARRDRRQLRSGK
jgi:23S rRNA pseudouridine2605 synthase